MLDLDHTLPFGWCINLSHGGTYFNAVSLRSAKTKPPILNNPFYIVDGMPSYEDVSHTFDFIQTSDLDTLIGDVDSIFSKCTGFQLQSGDPLVKELDLFVQAMCLLMRIVFQSATDFFESKELVNFPFEDDNFLRDNVKGWKIYFKCDKQIPLKLDVIGDDLVSKLPNKNSLNAIVSKVYQLKVMCKLVRPKLTIDESTVGHEVFFFDKFHVNKLHKNSTSQMCRIIFPGVVEGQGEKVVHPALVAHNK